jgi:hypothetical protein
VIDVVVADVPRTVTKVLLYSCCPWQSQKCLYIGVNNVRISSDDSLGLILLEGLGYKRYKIILISGEEIVGDCENDIRTVVSPPVRQERKEGSRRSPRKKTSSMIVNRTCKKL